MVGAAAVLASVFRAPITGSCCPESSSLSDSCLCSEGILLLFELTRNYDIVRGVHSPASDLTGSLYAGVAAHRHCCHGDSHHRHVSLRARSRSPWS
eukprot:755646-Hanusia_phi.AAC.5